MYLDKFSGQRDEFCTVGLQIIKLPQVAKKKVNFAPFFLKVGIISQISSHFYKINIPETIDELNFQKHRSVDKNGYYQLVCLKTSISPTDIFSHPNNTLVASYYFHEKSTLLLRKFEIMFFLRQVPSFRTLRTLIRKFMDHTKTFKWQNGNILKNSEKLENVSLEVNCSHLPRQAIK